MNTDRRRRHRAQEREAGTASRARKAIPIAFLNLQSMKREKLPDTGQMAFGVYEGPGQTATKAFGGVVPGVICCWELIHKRSAAYLRHPVRGSDHGYGLRIMAYRLEASKNATKKAHTELDARENPTFQRAVSCVE